MPIFYACLVLSVWFAHQPSCTSASDQCDTRCTDKPTFTPSRLVVKYGGPLKTTCTVCERQCRGAQFDVEKAIGRSSANGTAVVWAVDRVTEWDTSALCYYNDPHQVDHQCCTELHVTVYQPPTRVSIGLLGHRGPMLEGRNYTLQCAVQQAAPAEKLWALFYKDRTQLASKQPRGRRGLKEPQNRAFTLDFTPTREDNGVALWCQGRLELDVAEGRPAVTSANMTARVHYPPEVETLPSRVFSVSAGDPLHLSCKAEGNPAPVYQWTRSSHRGPASSSADFIINSTAPSDGGQYTCLASNSVGNVTVTFQVHVEATAYSLYLIALMCVSLLLLLVTVYLVYRKKKRVGKYDLTLRSRSQL